jgi:hypothetical protein
MRRDGTLVAFSLGNFVFARFDGAANDTAILDVSLSAAGVESMDWIPDPVSDPGWRAAARNRRGRSPGPGPVTRSLIGDARC